MYNFKQDKSSIQLLLFSFVGIAILHLLSLFDFEYKFYTLLRVVTFALSIVIILVVLNTDKDKVNILTITYSIIALIWNPVFPFYSDRGSWNILNVIVMIWSGICAYNAYNIFKKFK